MPIDVAKFRGIDKDGKAKDFTYFCLDEFTKQRRHLIRCVDKGKEYDCSLKFKKFVIENGKESFRDRTRSIAPFKTVSGAGLTVTGIPASDAIFLESFEGDSRCYLDLKPEGSDMSCFTAPFDENVLNSMLRGIKNPFPCPRQK